MKIFKALVGCACFLWLFGALALLGLLVIGVICG